MDSKELQYNTLIINKLFISPKVQSSLYSTVFETLIWQSFELKKERVITRLHCITLWCDGENCIYNFDVQCFKSYYVHEQIYPLPHRTFPNHKEWVFLLYMYLQHLFVWINPMMDSMKYLENTSWYFHFFLNTSLDIDKCTPLVTTKLLFFVFICINLN